MIAKITVCFFLYCVVRIEATCPEVKTAENFNVTSFASGVWHDIARYANHFETAEGCISAKYSMDDGVFRIDSIDVAEDEHHYVAATGTVGADGKIALNVATGYPRQVVDITLTIMYIENEKYAVIYDCIHQGDDLIESVWITARAKSIEGEDKENIINYLKSTHIDVDRLVWLDNSDENCN